MHLLQARLAGVGPFEKALLPFVDDDGRARRVTIIHGSGGVGKTTILAAIGATRPGHAIVLSSSALGGASFEPRDAPPQAVLEWWLGQDDPERPHPLRVGTPNTRLSPSDDEEIFRRREQAVFDKRAALGGFAFMMLPQNRWFSRQPIGISAPARTIARYDVRGSSSVDEATRADLTRETKQAIAYAEIGAALSRGGSDAGRRLDLLGNAMKKAVGALVSLAGFEYRGLDAASFEPMFGDAEGRTRPFDALPTRARHLAAFAALTVRLLWAAYPGKDPLESEAVVAIDDVDLHQDPTTQSLLARALSTALPEVQWIVTTSSNLVAGSVSPSEVIALRRLPELDRIELFVGDQALTH